MHKVNDWTRHNLKGKVRTTHVESAALSKVAELWTEESRIPMSTTAYNEEGNVVKELLYSLDGSLSKVGFTKYDAVGNRIEVAFQNPTGGLISLLICDYDDNGKELGCFYTSTLGLITKQKSVPVYDKAGHKAEETWFHQDGIRHRKYVYRYLPNGLLSEQLIHKYADDGSLEETRVSSYSENGDIVETSCFNAIGQPIEGRSKYKYDEDHNELEVATYNTDGQLYGVRLYSYLFDSSGNWIRRTESFKTHINGVETRQITYRTITYY